MVRNVLSIAGSDPSGGAGIQADLKSFAAAGCYGMAVVTALTAQNTRGVRAIHLPPADFVGAQIDAIFARLSESGQSGSNFGGLFRAMMNLRASVRLRARSANPQQIQAIVDALDAAAKTIETL